MSELFDSRNKFRFLNLSFLSCQPRHHLLLFFMFLFFLFNVYFLIFLHFFSYFRFFFAVDVFYGGGLLRWRWSCFWFLLCHVIILSFCFQNFHLNFPNLHLSPLSLSIYIYFSFSLSLSLSLYFPFSLSLFLFLSLSLSLSLSLLFLLLLRPAIYWQMTQPSLSYIHQTIFLTGAIHKNVNIITLI